MATISERDYLIEWIENLQKSILDLKESTGFCDWENYQLEIIQLGLKTLKLSIKEQLIGTPTNKFPEDMGNLP